MKPFGSRIVRLAVVATLVSGALSANEPGIDRPRRGDFTDDYRDPETKALIMRYRMIVPKRLPKKKTLGLIDGADHGGILRYPEVAEDNFRFIHALRNKEIEPSKDERRTLATSQKRLKKESADTALPRIAEIARLGGPAGAPAIRSALRNSDVAVRKAAIRAAGRVLFDRNVALELIRLTRDKSSEIRSAAFKGLSALANWRLPEAQAFLVQAARKRSLKVEDRLLAVKGLARAAKLMFLGWYEDKDVIWTLVLLLDDKQASVREAAFAALRKGAKETFGYSPDLAPKQRRAAAAKWVTWCEKQAGRPR